ncbi:anthrone oxygenase family protein [Streptosporangium sp. KLBMP 9127]|nr:DUF1772 domain-containing protein [Streptosporangium sp. KLBMP 9127]
MMFALAAFFAGLSLVLTGGVAGVFFAFSVAVMRGLDAIPPAAAITAMRGINRKILNPVFLSAFVGAQIASAATGALLLALGSTPAATAFFGAAAVYLLGAFVPTVAVNVPMNEALDKLPENTGDAGAQWAAYSPRWTRWNTARTVSCTISLLLIGLGLLLWG